MFVERNDGSSRSLPALDSQDLDAMLTMFSNLDDTDSIRGVMIMKQVLGYKASQKDRILEAVQLEDWSNALQVMSSFEQF